MTELAALKLMPSPIGKIAVGANDSGIVELAILTTSDSRVEFSDSAKAHKYALDAVDQLTEYFSGSRKKFTVPVSLLGTEFQRAVWEQIARLDFGEQKTYADIALAVGNPKAVRAVGGAVGANPVPLLIGCHRVLGSQRRITGYSGGQGIPTKEWLLNFEQITFIK